MEFEQPAMIEFHYKPDQQDSAVMNNQLKSKTGPTGSLDSNRRFAGG